MINARIGLLAGLLLWMVIFLGQTVYPDAKRVYLGMRGAARAWPDDFKEHEQLLQFAARTSLPEATVSGPILFAYGGDPNMADTLHFFGAIKYLIYPARMWTHLTERATAITRIAIYRSGEKAFHRFPFCRQAGEESYVCDVKPAEGSVQAYDLRVQYAAPDLTFVARTIGPGQSDPAFVLVSNGDVSYLITRQSAVGNPPEGTSLYRLRLTVGRLPLDVHRFQFHLLVVDKRGFLSVSKAHLLVLNPTYSDGVSRYSSLFNREADISLLI